MNTESNDDIDDIQRADRTPVLFIGHGSPMNAITETAHSNALKQLASELARPRAILVISAHWITSGTRITTATLNTQLFDFAGFPEELSKVQYTPPGNLALSERICSMLSPKVQGDSFRPLDHGCWCVLSRMYPEADIPVLQMSLDAKATVLDHVALGTGLRQLRDTNVLVIASGNIAHALGFLQLEPDAVPPQWITEFDIAVATALETNNRETLLNYTRLPHATRAIPEPSHYLPLLYVLGLRQPEDSMRWVYEGFEHGSVSMRSFMFETV